MVVTARTTIDRRREEVFAAFCDLERAVDRIDGIVAIERLAGSGFEPGVRWRETRRMFGKDATEEMWVSSVDAPREYRVEAESNGTRYETIARFGEAAAGTDVEWVFTGRPQNVLSRVMGFVMGPMIRRAVRRMVQQDLDDMKAALERGDVAA